jgi:TonB family protein
MCFRLFPLICLLGWTLLSGQTGAQEVGKLPSVDESKLPDWVKRQAASPQKLIINSAGVRPKAEPVKRQPVAAPTSREVERKLASQTTDPAANPASAPAGSLGEVTTESPSAEPPAIAPTPMTSAAVSSSPVQPTPVLPVAVVAMPMPALVLLKKVDPVLSPELLDESIDASVTVSFTVGIQGEIIDPQIATSGDQRLNRSVLRALQAWRYAPISEPRRHSVSFVFALNK